MVSGSAHIVLVTDSHPGTCVDLHGHLARNGFNVLSTDNPDQVRSVAERAEIDLVVLDIRNSGKNGVSLCRYLRDVRQTPVMFVTEKNEETQQIMGLDIGAEDYVVRPFDPCELVARISAILRKPPASPWAPGSTGDGGLVFDDWYLRRREKSLVSRCGKLHRKLTGAEYELLMIFLCHPRRVLARDELLEMTSGRQARPFDRTIDNQVRRLRKKVEAEPSRPRIIRTVWGRGYCLDVVVDRQSG
jgi:two-component system OmpR family response regulator